MWTAIYIAQNRKMAEKVETILMDEGMLVKIESMSKDNESKEGFFEILVPEGEANEARDILYEIGY